MCRLVKTCAVVILTGLVFAAVIGEARAVSQTKITDVRISEDLRRVVVKGNGPLNPVHKYRLEGQSRLAILMPDTTLGDVERTIRKPDSAALFVYISSSDAGVKLVLDFGKAGVPEFKIKVLDNCLIALLGPSGSPEASSEEHSFSSAAGAAAPPPRFRTARPQADKIETDSNDREDLRVCSADVVNGLVVLQVASKQNGGRKYKIKLGLNLDNLGFNSATICKVGEQGRTPRRMTNARPSPVASTSLAGSDGNPYHPRVSADATGSHALRRLPKRPPNHLLSRSAKSRGPVADLNRGVPHSAE